MSYSMKSKNIPACGLLVAGTAVPLKGVAVEVSIVAGQARVTVEQRWHNSESVPVEGVYVFPLPPQAAVTGLKVTCGEEVTIAQIDEREAAFATYDSAVLAGHGAALLEQERQDVFSLNLANLLPNETTQVAITFVQSLLADEGSLRWVLPTVVAPRYMPGTPAGRRSGHGIAEPTDRVADADRISPPIGDAQYRLQLRGCVQLGCKVNVSSPSHLLVEPPTTGAVGVPTSVDQDTVYFTLDDWPLDRDLIVDIAGAQGAPAGVVVQGPRGAVPGIIAATIVPDLGLGPRQPLQVVFVLDRSGSMDGMAMTAAKKALRLCLRHLRAGDRFGIIAFDDHLESLGTTLCDMGENTLTQADKWLEHIDARGGTELLPALHAALNLSNSGLIVLLTDGQIGNEDEVLAETIRMCKGARIYSLGIGTAVSEGLLQQMAEQTGGALERVHPDDGLDERVITLFAKATSARVTKVVVQWQGVDIAEQAPAEAPDLVDAVPWTLAAIWTQAGKGNLVLTGVGPTGEFRLNIAVELDAALPEIGGLAQIWAARRIVELEGLRVTGRRTETVKNEIVRVSKLFGVVSKYTSLVLVQQREGDRRAKGLPALRVVPVAAPHGWAMLQPPAALMKTGSHYAMPAPAPMQYAGPMVGDAGAPMPRSMPRPSAARRQAPLPPVPSAPMAIMQRAGQAVRGLLSKGKTSAPAADAQAFEDEMTMVCDSAIEPWVPVFAPTDPIEALLFLQRADGLWGDSADQLAETARILGLLADAGLTTAHPLHGAPVKKAVEALCARAEAGELSPLLATALQAALRVASGTRTRARVTAALGVLAVGVSPGA
ncbi:MAG: VWA domain-containing protein [Myxococcales bacterium]|nr:VWA domain-containing protein [Myxococcales bacterium]